MHVEEWKQHFMAFLHGTEERRITLEDKIRRHMYTKKSITLWSQIRKLKKKKAVEDNIKNEAKNSYRTDKDQIIQRIWEEAFSEKLEKRSNCSSI